MSYEKVLEVAKKFADAQETQNQNKKFQEQRKRLNVFFDTFFREFSITVNTIEGDIHTLKLKDFDRDTLRIMSKLFNNLVEYRKFLSNKNADLQITDVYPKINKIVNYVLDRNNLAIIDNLEFLTQHFMKSNQIDFQPTQSLVQSKLHGLKSLKRMALNARLYMDKNPLIINPGSVPPEQLPPSQFGEESKAGPGDETNPGVPLRKNPQAAE